MRDNGWIAQVVEQTIRGKGIIFKRDLFGIIDILALRGEIILGVQTTSSSNVSSRVKKIADSEFLPAIRKAGIMLHVHGWSKRKAGWTMRVIDVS